MRNTTREHLTIDSFVREVAPSAGENLQVAWRCPAGVSARSEVLIEVRYVVDGTPRLFRKGSLCSAQKVAAVFPHPKASVTGFQAVARLHEGDRNCPSRDFVAVSVRYPGEMRLNGVPPIAGGHALAAFSTIAESGWSLETSLASVSGKFPSKRRLRSHPAIFDFSSCPYLSIAYRPRASEPAANFRLFY